MAQTAKDIKVSTTNVVATIAATNVVSISPHIGIGDLLIYKSIALNENLHFKFHLKQSMVDKYRNASAEYKIFVEQLLDILKIPYVWDEKCPELNPDQLLNTYGIKNTNILHDIFPYKESNIMGDYIVIHTKCRLEEKVPIDKLCQFFKSFKANCGIVLLGEKATTQTYENNIHGVTSIYNELLVLKENNTLIDLTVDDVQGKPDIKLFLRDINLISGAKYNLLIGIGGNFVMSTLFGKASVTYIGSRNHPYVKSFEKSKEHNILRSIDEFTQKINKLVEVKQPIVAELPSEARLIKRWQLINAKEDQELKKYKPICPICKYDGDFKQRIAKDIFHAGELIRYECPQCDVIFGARKMLQLSDEEFAKDYLDVYSYYQEGDTSSIEEALFNMLNPQKGKIYLLYGCRDEVMIRKFRSLGYTVYGFDPYTSKSQYVIVDKSNLLNYKFDGIISNNLIEHLKDPVSELLFMKSIMNPGCKMIHSTECYDYLIEITHYHLFFFIGRSVSVLAKNTGLSGEVHRRKPLGQYITSYAVFITPQEKTQDKTFIKKQGSKKIALLLNHRTACLAILDVLKSLGHTVYIPAKCDVEPNSGLINNMEAISLRTIHNSLLDTIDFYRDFHLADSADKLNAFIIEINTRFDVVIMLPGANPYNITMEICNKINVQVVQMIWGDIGSDNVFNKIPIINNSNISYVFSLPQLLKYDEKNAINESGKHVISLPLNPELKSFNSTSLGGPGFAVISRIHNAYSNQLFQQLETLVNKYKLSVHLYGNNYSANTTNITSRYSTNFSCSTIEMYQSMAKDKSYMLYLLDENNVVQYSPLEAIYMGIPVFYLKTTLLAKLINDNNSYFACDTYDEMGKRASQVNGQKDIESVIAKQKSVLTYFDRNKAVEGWNKLLDRNELKDTVLVFGDSHSLIYRYIGNPGITTIVNHVGPVTMHRIGRDGADGFIAKHFTSSNKPVAVMAVFGEIDVRCHVGKIMDREKKSEDEVTTTLCNAYIKALQEVEKKYKVKIVIQSVVPPSDISYAHIPNHEFAAYSKVEELIKYTISVNKLLKAACDKLNWVFVDVYKSFVGTNGVLIASMSDGNVHINDSQWPLVSKIFNDAYNHHNTAVHSLSVIDLKVQKEPTK